MIQTKLCSLLGIQYPILQGGMVWVSEALLAASVSKAGGLGVIGTGAMTREEALKEIRQTKVMTDRPFGVNVVLLTETAGDIIQICLQEQVKVVITSAGSPKKFTPMLKKAGIISIHVSPSARLAKKAHEAGVDAVVAEGFDAGGHNSPDEIGTLALIPQVVDAVPIPVIAAGGFADGRGLVAALALGAQAIQMGTRFVASTESSAHPGVKEAIVRALEDHTVITGRKLGPTRILKNKLSETILAAEARGVTAEELLRIIGFGRSRKALVDGDLENGSLYCGQSAGLIHEIKPAQAIIADIMKQATDLIRHLKATLY